MAENRWVELLRNHYSVSLNVVFKQFRLGAALFFTGAVIIFLDLKYVPPSTRQEVILLAGLAIGGSGFLIAMLAQVRMIISRIVQFFSDQH